MKPRFFARSGRLATASAVAIALPIALGIVSAAFMRAQSSENQRRLAFYTASVKPTSAPTDKGLLKTIDGAFGLRIGLGIQKPLNTGGPGTDDPGRIHYSLITLKQLLQRAWGVSEVDGPSWLGSQWFTVDATMPPNTTQAQFQEMLRNLITARFGLQYHTGKKDLIAYSLVIDKNGPNLKESADQGQAEAPPVRPTGSKDGFNIYPPFAGKALLTEQSGDRSRIIAQQEPIQALSRTLSWQLKTGVTNATGLTAKYDFTLTYASLEPASSPAHLPEGLEPSIDKLVNRSRLACHTAMALAGAVVSNPTPKKTTRLAGLEYAILSASDGE